jgi:hypothetical protein
MSDWNKAKTQALKVLGEGGKVPDVPGVVLQASKTFQSMGGAFKTAREACEAQLLKMDNSNSAFMNAIEQFRARVEKNDLGLDPKKDAKKIEQAQKVLTDALDDSLKDLKDNDKVLDELDRHMIQLSKYKPAAVL